MACDVVRNEIDIASLEHDGIYFEMFRDVAQRRGREDDDLDLLSGGHT